MIGALTLERFPLSPLNSVRARRSQYSHAREQSFVHKIHPRVIRVEFMRRLCEVLSINGIEKGLAGLAPPEQRSGSFMYVFEFSFSPKFLTPETFSSQSIWEKLQKAIPWENVPRRSRG